MQKAIVLLLGILIVESPACRSAPEEEPEVAAPLEAESVAPPAPATTVTLVLADGTEVDATPSGGKITFETHDGSGNTITCQGPLEDETLTITCDNAPNCTVTFQRDLSGEAKIYRQNPTGCT